MVSVDSASLKDNASNVSNESKDNKGSDNSSSGKSKVFVDPGLPKFSISDLMASGVHYGHRISRWNPRMGPYIYGKRNGIYIFDLNKTYVLLNRALKLAYDVVKNNGRILFVGTRRQVREAVKNAAVSSGQYYVTERWLGGMLTNWSTIIKSVAKLEDMEHKLKNEEGLLKKKELLVLQKKRDKSQLELGGIRNMGAKPDLLFVLDSNVDNLAIKEANRLNIPVISIVDTNSSLDMIDFPVPGNDDSIKAVELYCKLFTDAIVLGMKKSVLKDSSGDNSPGARNSGRSRNYDGRK